MKILSTAATGTSRATFILAHGSGAGMDTPFMTRITELLTAAGISVARFEFAYMAARRETGKKRPPPRADRLIPEYADALNTVLRETEDPVLIGGKSMGGRVAAMLAGGALDPRVRGVVCLGYPFHPTGKPDDWRLPPLQEARLPVFIAQGDRDPFGNHAEVAAVSLPENVRITWLSDGNHDLAPRGKAEATWAGNLRKTAEAIAAFAGDVTA